MIYRKTPRRPTRMLLQVVAATAVVNAACYRVDHDDAPGSSPSYCEENADDPSCASPGLADAGPVGTAPGVLDAGPGPEPCTDDAGNPTCGISADPDDAATDAASDAGESDQ